MPRTSDHFPHPPQQTPSSRPAPDVPASASSEPHPQVSSWSQQAFVSPSMSTTTTPIMNWMQAFTTPVQAPSQHSLLYEQLQYPTALHSTTLSLSLLAGLKTPLALTEASNCQTGPPPQQQQHPQTRQYPLHEPLPSSMVLSLLSPSYPQTPIPHRPLQKRPSRDEDDTIPATQELIAPRPILSKDEDQDGMSMTQELLTSPLVESPPKKKRKAPSSPKEKLSSSPKKKRKQVEKTPPAPKSILGISEVDVVCIGRNRINHPGNIFYNQLVQEQARTLAQEQWKVNQQNQNKKVESAGSRMERLEIENTNPSSPKEPATSKRGKLEVSRGIVDKIRQRDGKFLFRQKDDIAFYDIGDTNAIRKTSLQLQKAETAWLKTFLKSPPQDDLLVHEPSELDHEMLFKKVAGILSIPPPLETPARVAPQISIPSPKKKRRGKNRPKSDEMLVKQVAGILNIPPPPKPPESILNTRVVPPIPMSSPWKDGWNPKGSPELEETLVKTVAGILNIPPSLGPQAFIHNTRVVPPIPMSSPLKDRNPAQSPVHDKEPPQDRKPYRCQEQEPYRLFVPPPPQIPTESDLPDSRNRLEAADFQLQQNPFFQRHYQESILLRPPQILTGDLPEIGLPAFEDRNHFSPPAASLPVSRLSTRSNPNNRLEPIDFQLQYQRCYEEQFHRLLPPPQMPTDGDDLPEIASPSVEIAPGSNFSPAAASFSASKLSTRSNSNNYCLEPTDFQLQYQYQRGYEEQLHRLLSPPQMPTDGNLPEIASPSVENAPGSNFSPAAASFSVSNLISTRPNSNNCLGPTEFLQNLFTQHYQHDDDDTQDWFRAYDSR